MYVCAYKGPLTTNTHRNKKNTINSANQEPEKITGERANIYGCISAIHNMYKMQKNKRER